MTNHSLLLRSAALGLALFALVGCDVTDPLEDVELRVDISDAPVDISASAGTLTVLAGTATAAGGTVTNDTDIDRIENLEAITIRPAYLTFTPAAASVADDAPIAAQTGTLSLYAFIAGVPLPCDPALPINVTIEDDVVTAVTPQRCEIGGATIDAATIEAFIASLPPGAIALTAGWENFTVNQVVDAINAALASSSIDISIGVTATGDLDGTLRLSQITFDAEAVLSD